MITIPYPRPPRGPLREISDRLELGMLSPASARELSTLGLEWQLIAPHVHDMDWWRDQPLNRCAPANQQWQINAWDATLRLSTSEMIVWIDPGPSAPIPSPSPELVILTHAHADHIDRLQEWLRLFPDMRIAMTELTAQLLSLRFSDTGVFQQIMGRAIRFNFNQKRTIAGVSLEFLPAGHLLGAAMIEIQYGSDRILVTGDFALREVGGLPGVKIPSKDYAFVIMESTEAARKSLPYADLESTRVPFLRQVMEIVATGQRVVQINVQSLGQAQEAYAALVMTQRAGAFPAHTIYLDGLACSVSDLYSKHLGYQAGPWSPPFLELADTSSTDRLVIGRGRSQTSKAGEAVIVESSQLYTHAGWAEKMAFAVKISCHQLYLYHGFSTSLDVALHEIGRNTGALTKEIAK
jgi:Cft2 family RNA processing exonuclease